MLWLLNSTGSNRTGLSQPVDLSSACCDDTSVYPPFFHDRRAPLRGPILERNLSMTQSELNRAVAKSTGETVAEIKHLGFSLADPDDVTFDPEPDESWYVDWDATQADRHKTNSRRPCHERAFA